MKMHRPLLALGAALVLAACSKGTTTSSTSTSEASPAASGSKTIGVSIQNREAQFYEDMEAGMKAEAAKRGYKVVVVDASRDNAKQQTQVEDFIAQKVDGDRPDPLRLTGHRQRQSSRPIRPTFRSSPQISRTRRGRVSS